VLPVTVVCTLVAVEAAGQPDAGSRLPKEPFIADDVGRLRGSRTTRPRAVRHRLWWPGRL